MHRAFIIFFFFNDTATTEIYTLSLHDALPTSSRRSSKLSLNHPGMSMACGLADCAKAANGASSAAVSVSRTEEHTSELQSPPHIVCRLLLEKKKKVIYITSHMYTTAARSMTLE